MTTDSVDSDSLKELRLALVCYGGVSLAVYMHGLAQELHRLVIASTSGKPAPDGTTQAVYRELLDELAVKDGVRTCVVVDIISGTSAGGINGVSLARALAQDGELTPVRDLWLDHADITKLLREEYRRLAADTLPTLQDVVPGLAKLRLPGVEPKPRNPLVRARDAIRVAFTLRRDVGGVARTGSVLHGDQLSYLIADGLRGISSDGAGETLMPKGHQLDLFVTMTDRYGYAQHVPLGDQYVTEMANRHFNTFTRDEHRNDFDADTVDMLGFSGRATSSFPGAFEPISMDAFAHDVGEAPAPSGRPVAWPPTQVEHFYRVYGLRLAESRPDPRRTRRSGGGPSSTAGCSTTTRSTTRSTRSGGGRRAARRADGCSTSSPTRCAGPRTSSTSGSRSRRFGRCSRPSRPRAATSRSRSRSASRSSGSRR
jgi:patatin-related protein